MDYVSWLRGHVGPRKVLLVYATALIVDERGRLLWQLRGDAGWWGLPGGVVERGESLREAVAREVREETGLHVAPQRLIGVYSSPDYDLAYANGDAVQQVSFCFSCVVVGGTLAADGLESVALAWRGEDQATDTAPWYRAMVADWQRGDTEATFRGGGAAGGSRPLVAYFRYLRRYVGQAAYIQPSAVAFVVDDDGRVLFQQRRDTGLWGLPGGGMELGERLDQTVINEVAEETGLQVAVERIIGVYSGPPMDLTYPNGDRLHLVSTLFRCRVIGGALRADGEESLAVRFFPRTNLPQVQPRGRRRLADALADRPGAVFP